METIVKNWMSTVAKKNISRYCSLLQLKTNNYQTRIQFHGTWKMQIVPIDKDVQD